MNLKQLTERAMEVRDKYSTLEKSAYGREWTPGEIAQGFVGDVGDLMKLVMTKEGIRDIENVDEKLVHELSDCLWSLLVIAKKYNIDLERAFFKTMTELDARF
jgi:NTP pyrophosphatase (non-canonical NTP hydrolase)